MEVLADRIARFLAVGNGDGYGDGDGYGYGNGYGDGNGDGYGNGNGDGYGYGYGYGDGDGYGYGDGDGYGYGNGYGDGYGIVEIDGHKVYSVDDVPTVIFSVNLRKGLARCATIRHNSILVPCWVAKVGDCYAHGDTAHAAFAAATEKYEESLPMEQRIAAFVKAHDLDGEYPMEDFFAAHHRLTGSCEFGRREFCEAHGIKEGDTLTTWRFLNLTKDAYGRDAIRQVMAAYGIKEGER